MFRKIVIAGLILSIGVLPIVVIADYTPLSDGHYFMFKVRIHEKLAENFAGEYFLVELLAGDAPASNFVLYVPDYTKGLLFAKLLSKFDPNQEFWGQGRTMRPETYYGPQYLFFDRPQVCLYQIKGFLVWPEQTRILGRIYLAPIEVIGIGLFLASFDPASALLILATFILINVILLKIIGKDVKNRVILVLVYILLSMILVSMWM